MYEQLLSNYCRQNNTEKIKGVLLTCKSIDLKYDNGVCFKFAFEHESAEMLTTLLFYYREHILGYNIESMEYKRAYADLRTILEDALEQYEVSDQIKVVLAPYISVYDEDSECDTEHSDIANLSDLEDFDHHDPHHNRDSSEKSLELHGKDSGFHNTVFI